MFTKSAKFYDALYSWKDYPEEARLVHEAIESHKTSSGKRLLDVACGTGRHLAELANWYEAEGLDVDTNLLRTAEERLPGVPLHQGDMRSFDLDRGFDAVTCLFSSIGYMTSLEDCRAAIANMGRHVAPGGVLVVEPWLYPDQFKVPHLHLLTVDQEDVKIVRVSRSDRRGDVSIMDFEYLVVSYEDVVRESERHEMGLFSREDYEMAIHEAGFAVEYDPIGPMGRGLFVGMKPE